ncbi:TPA: mechanosensitive ion channel family protein [Candidatus Woesearchaeota archaeon]|nr:mechanosensitive ion channel family protein [Candidatus Woesearchaeota archaeon]
MALQDQVMDGVTNGYWYLLENKFIKAVIVLVAVYLGSQIVYYILEKYVKHLTSKTKTKLDDLILAKISRPISLILLLAGIRFALIPLNLHEKVSFYLFHVVSTLIAIIIGYIVTGVLKILIHEWGKKWAEKTMSKIDDQLVRLLDRFSYILVVIIVLMFLLDSWGIKIGPLLASLGVAGIAVAFALQNTLNNVFGGISMIVDKSLKVGDEIEIDATTKGIVLDVGFRSTKIKTRNNEIIIMPNGQLANSKIVNYVLPDSTIRIAVPFSVAYGSDIIKVKMLVLNEVSQIKGVLKDPGSSIYFKEMGASSLNFDALLWVKDYQNRFKIKDEANTRIYNALNSAGISIPFPQMDVHVRNQ